MDKDEVEKLIDERVRGAIGQFDIVPKAIKRRHIDLTDGVGVIRLFGNALSAEQNTNNASKPAIVVNNGTYQDDTTLDYDASTDELDFWEAPISPGIIIDSATLYIAYRMASATSGSVIWGCVHGAIADSETWDVSWTEDDMFDADVVPVATTKLGIANKVLTTTNWSAGDSLRLGVYRDADEAGDDATGDAKLAWWMLEIK